MTKALHKYIGTRQFYKGVLAVAVPIMVQNGITNLVNLLDNVMVGSLGTEAMSGVSIVNQFLFVFNLLIFGSMSACGIFTSQYHGAKDYDGVRSTFRLKAALAIVFSTLAIVAFILLDDELISIFLHTGGDPSLDLAKTLEYGKEYLTIYLFAIIPYSVSQIYASTLRECGETLMPMYASLISVFTNFALNGVLIFGLLGFPALGVTGAAIATVIARVFEMLFIVIIAHAGKRKYHFISGVYRSFKIPRALAVGVVVRGLPILFNECLWSLAITAQNQAYSVRGLDVVASLNIASVIINLLSVVYMALSSSIGILVGARLGAGEIDDAKDTATKMLVFSLFSTLIMGGIMAAIAPFFPLLYETTGSVRSLATFMIIVSAVLMPFCSYTHSVYYILRSGGSVISTVLMDCGFMWAIAAPTALLLAHFTALDIRLIFLIVKSTELLKVALSIYLLRRGTWVKRLVDGLD